MAVSEASQNSGTAAPLPPHRAQRQQRPEPPRLPARGRRRPGARLRELWTRRPNLFAFLLLGSLVLGLAVSSWSTGFHSGFWPNFLLNSAGDLIGGMIVLFLIEPIVRQAAAQQIRQHPRLDYAWFLRRVGEARKQIRILDTFSGLFSGDRDAAIRALRDAAIQGADIRVLLMSPNTDASALREFQLRQTIPGLWINDLIQANISDFRLLDAAILAVGNGLPHGRLELRLYTVAAPFALYGWDDRAMFAFLPPHAYSDHSTQLEITDQSQLGREALDQFEAIWADAAPIPQLLPVRVVDEQATRDLLVRFVHIDNATYLVSKRIDAAIHANPALRVRFGDQSTAFQPEAISADDPVARVLDREFYAKYARRPDAGFHLLRPEADMNAPTDRPREYDTLPVRTLMDLIGDAERVIRILDTSSTLIAEGGTPFVRTVEQALERGVKVQVLLLAPTTQAAQDRAAEIQDPAFEARIEENIRQLRRLARKALADGVAADRLEVRLYDRLPECSVHQVDDRIMVAFLPYQRRTSRVKHLEIGHDASLGQFAQLQFESKWAAARPLEGMKYADLRNGQDVKRLLLRIWEAAGPVVAPDGGGARGERSGSASLYLASNRIEGILAAAGVGPGPGEDSHVPQVRLIVEGLPGQEYCLSEPIFPDAPEGILAAEAFAAVFGAAPDAPIRRLDPVDGQDAQRPRRDGYEATTTVYFAPLPSPRQWMQGRVPADASGSPRSDAAEPTAAQSASVSIYLCEEAAHEQVERAVDEALKHAGLDVVERSDPVIGSWFRRMTAGRAAETAVHALENRVVTAQDAQITALLLQSLPAVIASLQPYKDAVVRIQAVLIVKIDWVVAVHQLSAAQQYALDHKPQLATSPHEIVSALALAADGPLRDEPSTQEID
ncbi:hypothetical protein KGA66_12455 [Actinocrinis puniceicyclus]|uniref:Uncharacterized protein n=1 Tax=Actinocrinis puniceicyclus TaxID=977794 RepID=A0A8J8BD97_9ACTN|nr:hypothetical protein [Actinocrinis puniceicyclus]MBS2963861.1 hypothetical protein [Actinocrinis puniceicyclus]